MAPLDPRDPDRRLLRAFGRRLVRVREERGLSQQAIGLNLGVGHDVVSKYERGLHAPRLGTLVRLRILLSVSLDYLLVGAPSGGITDSRLLRWARAANQLSPGQRNSVALQLERIVRAAQALGEPEPEVPTTQPHEEED